MNKPADGAPRVLLLAAGQSRRFGADKTLHPLADGMPMALATAQRILRAGVRLAIVLRPEQQRLAELLGNLPVDIIWAPQARDGLGASLAAGVRATAEAAGWLIALADMPDIGPNTYRMALARLAAGSDTLIVAPEHQGRRGHPVGFGPAWRQALAQLQGDVGARPLLLRHAAHLRLFASDDPGVLHDVDTPGDLHPRPQSE